MKDLLTFFPIVSPVHPESSAVFCHRKAVLFAWATLLVGLLGWVGWWFDLPELARAHPASALIAPQNSFQFIVVGILLLIYLRNKKTGFGTFMLVMCSCLFLFFLLSPHDRFPLIESLYHSQACKNRALYEFKYQLPPFRIFLYAVIAFQFLVFAFNRRISAPLKDALGGFLFITFMTGLTLISGFLYQEPLLTIYGHNAISFLGAVAVSTSMLTLLYALGPTAFPLNQLMGDSIRSQLLRTFLPLGMTIIFVYVVLDKSVFYYLQETYSSLLGMLLTTIVSGVIIAQSSDKVSARIEKMAQETERKFTRVIDSLKEYTVLILDPNGYILTWNNAAKNLNGYTDAEILGEHFSIFLTPEDQANQLTARMLEQAVKQDGYENQWWHVRKDGSRFWAHVVITPLYSATHQLQGFSKVTHDITHQLQAEETLRNQARRSNLLRTISVTINEETSLEKVLRVTMSEVCHFTGWSLGHFQWVHTNRSRMISSLWHHEKPEQSTLFQEHWENSASAARDMYLSQVITTKQPIWLLFPQEQNLPMFVGNHYKSHYFLPVIALGEVVAVFEFFSETPTPLSKEWSLALEQVGRQLGLAMEREQNEQQMKESLIEKELLLREIHHRVKNNLQIIISLLRLQTDKIQDQGALQIFQESQDRIRSMALIHEFLYQSTDLARIRFSEYVQHLVKSLCRSYGVSNSYEVVYAVEELTLKLDLAIPCGLILTELVSNVLKYAYPTSNTGYIKIGFVRKENKYQLSVEDHGVGFPPNFQWETSNSLGLRLVHSLSRQIDGDIQMTSSPGNGTRIVLTF